MDNNYVGSVPLIEIELPGGARGLKGDQGPKGDKGDNYNPIIEEVETLEPTQPATAEVRADDNNIYFSFGIPKGDPGEGTKLSDFDNDVGFVTADTTELENYALISNTYTKTEVDNSLSSKANTSDVNTALATKVNTSDVIDNLTSTETAKPLSAKQGKVLNEAVEGLDERVNGESTIQDEGTNLTLENTTDGVITFKNLKGNTTQDGTPTPDSPVNVNVATGGQEIEVCGKNLFNATRNNATDNGVTFTKNSDGTYTANGTATGFIGFTVGTIKFPVNTEIIYSGCPANGSAQTYSFNLQKVNGSVWLNDELGNGRTTTLEANEEYYVRLIIRSGVSVNNLTYKPMIRLSSISDDTYEEYKGTTYKINLGKNLFDINQYSNAILRAGGNNVTLTKENDTTLKLLNKVSSSRNYCGIPIPNSSNLLGNIITVNADITINGNTDTAFQFWFTNSTSLLTEIGTAKKITNNGNQTYTATIPNTMPNNATGIAIVIYGSFDSQTEVNSYVTFNKIQIEKGSVATTFTPYKTPIELCKIGDYQDRIYKDSGKWYIEKNIGKIESYNGETITTNYISTTGQLTTGATVYYVLATPTINKIIDNELINQLDALYNARSYIGQTNISVDGDLPVILDLEAYTDTLDGDLKALNKAIDGKESAIEDFVLYAFFDEKNSNEINLFISKDNLHLTKLELPNKIYGRDASIVFYNNKFYISITNYDSQHDFSVYESDDLISWVKRDVNLGLYDATYQKRWAPHLFIDDDNSLYVFISKQYAASDSTNLEGKFKTYIAKCNNVDTLSFDTPVELILSETEEDNYIDAACIKIDGTYHLILKSDSQNEVNLQHFTSNDLLNFAFIEKNFGKFGRFLEGQFIYKFKDEYVIGAEKYAERDGFLSNYRIKTTKDLSNFSNYRIMFVEDTDLSHGSAFVIDNQKAKDIIFKNNDYSLKYDYDFVKNTKKNYMIACNTTAHPYEKGRYLKVMSIYPKQNWKAFSILFKITDTQNINFDSLIQISGKVNNLSVPEFETPMTLQLNARTQFDMNFKRKNLHGKIITLPNTTNKCYDVYFDLNDYSSDMTIMLDLVSTNLHGEEIVIYSDEFIDDLPTNVPGMRDQRRCLNVDPQFNTLYIDNKTNTKLTMEITIRNQTFRLCGHGSNATTSKIYDYTIGTYQGAINAVNNNHQLANPLTFTVDNYDSNTGVYTISITGIDTYSGFFIELPNTLGSSILDYTLSAS